MSPHVDATPYEPQFLRPSMIVFDTDVLSELMRGRPSPELVARLERTPVVDQATTAITLGEIAYGARKARKPALYDRASR